MEKETVSVIGRAVYSACVRIDLLAYFTAADGRQFNQRIGYCKVRDDNCFLTCGNRGIGTWFVRWQG